jgi:hypothetical protein
MTLKILTELKQYINIAYYTGQYQMKIHFYGDSHTLGAEIDDHTIMRKSFDEVNYQKKMLKKTAGWTQGMIAWNTEIATKLNKKLWEIANRVSPNSFPKVVSRTLSRSVRVQAQTAMSMEYLCLQLYNDYSNGEIENDDIVLVSLPRPTRSYSLNREGGEYDVRFLNLIGSLSPDMREKMITAGVPENLLVDTFLTDYRQVAEYYKNMQSIMDFAKINNIHLRFLHTIKPEYIRVDATEREPLPGVKTHCEVHPEWQFYDFCKNVYAEMERNWLLIDANMYSIAKDTELCGFHHPNADVHERFAKMICQELQLTASNLIK